MARAYKSPGVEREDVFLKPQMRLQTGIPGFVGFAETAKTAPKVIKPNDPFPLRRKQELTDNFSCRADGFLGDAVGAFFDNGGERCYVVRTTGSDEAALTAGIDALARAADLDLVAVPDAMMLTSAGANRQLDRDAIQRVQGHAVAHCAAQGDRLAILDALPSSDVDALLLQRDAILLGQHEPVSAALYHPWLRTLEGRLVPPSGAITGIFARIDARTGVHKAPANDEVAGVNDLVPDIGTAVQDRLNPEGINCLRAFPGRGIRVWGARTISRDPSWRYVNVRRLVLTLRRWITLNMAWAGFEPNEPGLWMRIERELRGHLTSLWRAGALSGDTPDAAFYVKCDAETNPPETRDLGEVVTEIGIAPNPPAEFIVIRLTQREGVADLLPR
jgi:phage tail sheath protein FI